MKNKSKPQAFRLIIPVLTSMMVLIIIASCVSSSKQLQKGNYDAAIEKAVKTLIKKPGKTDEIATLEKAFELANNKDHQEIKELKLSGQPDVFEEVVNIYHLLQQRQETVERLPNVVLNKIGFQHFDYSHAIVESKNKAAEYLNAHATSLLKTGNSLDARQAHAEFLKVKEYFPNYYEIDSKISEALEKGTHHVIFQMTNESRTALPQDFEDELLKISLKLLDNQWLVFDTYDNPNIQYNYSIYLMIKNIQTTPDFMKEVNYKEEKEIDDGFDYVLDGNGNVMKDSTGNDIRVRKTKIITCYITESQMDKKAIISGTLDFYNNKTGQLILTQPLSSEFVFNHRFANANGDLNALKPETKRLLDNSPVPFPTDLQIIFDTNEDLKRKVKSIIAENRKILERSN